MDRALKKLYSDRKELRKQQPAFLRGVPLLALGELSTQQSVDTLSTQRCRLPKIAKRLSAPLSGAQTHRYPARALRSRRARVAPFPRRAALRGRAMCRSCCLHG